MERKQKKLFIILVITMIATLGWGTFSQTLAKEEPYPAKEINMCIGAPPGGSLDISGRVISKVLSQILGKPVIIINKPGGTQSVAVSYVANAKPDGYTLNYMLNPYVLMKKIEEPSLPYSVDKLTWLGSTFKFNFMLTVRADSPWKTYEEFVDYDRKNPGKIIFGSDGAGGSQHLMQLQFAEMVGIKSFTHVPFAGGGPAVQALLGGHVNAVTISPGPTGPYVKSGDFRWLVYFSPERNKEYANIPSIKEKGLNVYGGGWTVFAGPKGLPFPITQKLTQALKEAALSQEVKAIFQKMGWEYEYRPPEDCAQMWKEEESMFSRQMKKLGMIK